MSIVQIKKSYLLFTYDVDTFLTERSCSTISLTSDKYLK